MFRKVVYITIFILTAAFNQAQIRFPSYYSQNDMEFATPGTILFSLGGYSNPAILSFTEQPNLLFTWNDLNADFNDFNNYSLFASMPYFGFSMVDRKESGYSITDYKISTAFGSSSFSFGLGYGWSSGDIIHFDRSNVLTIGTIYRPVNFLSFSLIGNLPANNEREGIIGVGLRPFGNYNLTLFGDYLFTQDTIPENVNWSAGAIFEPVDGLRIIGRYFEAKAFNVGVQLGFGALGISTITHFNNDAKHSYNTYGIRLGARDRNLLNVFKSDNSFVEINLAGGLKYQKFKFFDNSNTLFNIIEQLDAVIKDNSVSGIAINLSGANINKEMLWELREKLKEIKYYGKKVYVYVDRAGIELYHFASVADKIILDPMGTISLEGYLMGRTFFKGTLDLLGLGFHELRYFKYKSAVESFSREDFSDADREQRQKLVDDNFSLAQRDICEARKFSTSYFNELVDSNGIFLPDDAIKYKLADTLARWSDISEIINKYEKENKSLINAGSLDEFVLPDDYWGPKPKVALIYAIGGTSMDDGIKAWSLVKYVEDAINSNNVKAIVLRVDSPGGDALAADLIAEVLRKGKGKKPIIVSQGYVAASGGYWLSMYADTIVAAPNTITGSIGVIGSFIFNKTLKQNIGLSTDFVKKGKFADLGFGAVLPLIGISLPDRDFSDDELKLSETVIKTMYKGFVDKVALGRNKSFNEIEQIAQGRVWSGSDGLNNGLVDVLGGLDTAIKIALQKSGLLNKEYEIIQLPEPGWFDLSSLLPDIFRIKQKVSEDQFIRDLKFRLQYNGIPMPLLPIDFIDDNMIIRE
ncbi:MAG: S49 family peptidase [Ignavibacterium sp.]|jgi:protease-4|nr:S49 family peptidase [Ignavibacterium sp.]